MSFCGREWTRGLDLEVGKDRAETEGQAVDVMEINRHDDLGDIAGTVQTSGGS